MHPSCLTLLALSILDLPCQLWGIITFEWVISLCWDFPDNFISPTLIQPVFPIGDLFWVRENWHPKYEKNLFFKISSILWSLMHITSLFSYTYQLQELLSLVFLLILCSQTYPDAAKASTHYADPQLLFMGAWSVVIAFLRTAATQKNFCITPSHI